MPDGILHHPLELPGLFVPGNLFLAPLAGFTDAAFRKTCLLNGADLTFSEMVSCEGIIRENRKTTELMTRAPGEDLFAIQVFSGEPESARKCVPLLLRRRPSLIDLNCGCPVPKVTKNGAGSALSRDPESLGKVVRALIKGLNEAASSVPVSVKIRSGWQSGELTYREAALRAVEAGAVMITLHPRTRAQGYSGSADWECLARLKEELPVPVIGSGDLFSPEDARRMLTETGCDGIMFARGALGNPSIFSRTKSLLTTGILPPELTPEEKLKTAREHLERAMSFLGDHRACREMKKHLCSYTKGIPQGGALRDRLVHAVSAAEYPGIFDSFLAERSG